MSDQVETSSDQDIYYALIVIADKEGSKIINPVSIGIEITVPKNKKLDKAGYYLRLITKENEYLYQLQTLPPEIQQEIEKLSRGEITPV